MVLAVISKRSLGAGTTDSRLWPLFVGPHSGLTLFRGWKEIFLRASKQIRDELMEGAIHFHWVLVDEDEGRARLLYVLTSNPRFLIDAGATDEYRVVEVRGDEVPTNVRAFVRDVVNEVVRLCGEACIVCGCATSRQDYFGHVLPLCLQHRPEHLTGPTDEGLEGVWRAAIEWEVAATCRAMRPP